MRRLRLLADDLTGALDTAAMFAGTFGPVPVLLEPDEHAAEAVGYDLACRDQDAGTASGRAEAAAVLLRDAQIAYLKIDSLLRGPWPAVLAAIWRSGAFTTCVLAPAFPAQGRATIGGRQVVQGDTPRIVAEDIAALLAAQGLPARHVATAQELGGGHVQVCDARSDADLRALAGAAKSLDGSTLWCGSAGLAAALAEAGAPSVTKLPWPRLGIVGSVHPVTRSQLAHLSAGAAIDPHLAIGGMDDMDRVCAHLTRHGRCLLTMALAPGLPAVEAAAAIAARLHRALPRLPVPGTLIASGGETLRAICEALGAQRLAVAGVWAAGIPVARFQDGAWRGTTIVSKSGAFGAENTLTALLFDGDD